MKPKHQRLIFIAASVLFLCVSALFTLRAFRENLVFFYSPTELSEQHPSPGQLIRIGGLVKKGSIVRGNNLDVHFIITDGNADVPVDFSGMLPALFREGQGAVAEGHISGGGFSATRVLTKHDEKYMPPEVVDALKKSRRWKEQ